VNLGERGQETGLNPPFPVPKAVYLCGFVTLMHFSTHNYLLREFDLVKWRMLGV
jgi:hypothetical protein